MLTRFAATLAAALALATAPLAAEEAKTPEACLEKALATAEKAEGKELAEDKLTRIEGLLTKLEADCEASRFADAAAATKEIESILAGQ